MKEPVLYQWMDPGLVKAMCWTLIHSLWIGAVAALLAGVIMVCTRRSRPALRYRLFTCLLLLFALAVTVYFVRELSIWDTEAGSVAAGTVAATSFSSDLYSASVLEKNSWQPVIDYCNRQSGWIVFAWMLLFLYQMARLSAGLLYIHRIRTVRTVAVPAGWQQKAVALSQAMGIRQKIEILQSALVRVPVVIGFFKPVVLLPVGLITQLDPRHVEAILLHELAHIRRKDFAVNLLQSFLESVFFFNPGVLWLSAVIRDEREACCDDMVVNYTSDKKNYFQALLCFQEQKASFAMALQTRKAHLLHRVTRMLTNENKKLNIMERIILVSGLMLFSAFAFLPAAQNTQQPVPVPPAAPAAVAVKPSVAATTIKPEQPLRAAKVRAAVPAPEVIPPKPAMPVPAEPADPAPKPVAPDSIPAKNRIVSSSTNMHDDGINRTAEVTAVTGDGKKYYMKLVNGVTQQMTVDGKNIPKEEMNQHNDVLLQIEQRERLAKQKREQAEQQRVQRAQQRKQELIAQQSIREKKRLQTAGKKQEKGKLLQSRQQKNKWIAAENAQRRKQELQARQADRPKNEVSGIIQELSREQVISSTDQLSFTLTENELIVNGTRQEQSLQQRLKERYNLKEGDRIEYRKTGGSTTTSIHRN